MKEKKYLIETFGCQMNVHDSEKIAGMLIDLGFEETLKKEEADIVVFNTCCIRESAELKIMAKIGELKALKRKNKDLIIVVCGCMTQQKNMPELLKKRFPFISLILGTHNLDELENYLLEFENDKKFKSIVWEKEGNVIENKTIHRTSKNNAWVNIMFGCNNFCTYCIVPFVRGRERSREVKDILEEVAGLVKSGEYKTITLLGQNVNSYGKDLATGKTNFVQLLEEICKIEGDYKIKFLTSHPKDFSDELVEFIAKNDKMSKAIHLPVQSGSDSVLKRMNRHYDITHYKNLVSKIHSKIPNVTLTTDIIVGFPGESEEDFEKTCELLRFCNFSGVFGFVYSKRKGTPAENFENQISPKEKQKRITKLFEIQHEILKNQLKNMVGQTFETVIESKNGEFFVAKTDGGKSIRVKSNSININDKCFVIAMKIENNELFGEVTKEKSNG
ncbi:MAG: tRNA (N6-isopentenyl adenosine(37)-C2)-methylthiotransferase MiaB [Clostridia bacterium]|nr:tRNA (N6-isopentenyl adenosine(37)-C2)-methylthiotransferase MiaB [Clostridia bacterium]